MGKMRMGKQTWGECAVETRGYTESRGLRQIPQGLGEIPASVDSSEFGRQLRGRITRGQPQSVEENNYLSGKFEAIGLFTKY